MGRRGWATLAVLLVGVVAGIGVATGGLPRNDPAPPTRSTISAPPLREAQRVFTLSVDVTTSGAVWLTTAGDDCGGCVVVWRRTSEEASWVPLRQVGSDHRPGQIRMAESSIDGLIGGEGLWVTHDGGDSWNAEQHVPVLPGDEVQPEVAGGDAWALVRRAGSPPQLWRSPLEVSDWREVPLPGPLDPDAAPVVVGDALLLWVAGDPDVEAVATGDGGRTWRTLDPPCARGGGKVGTTAAYTTCLSRQGLEVAVVEDGAWETWPLADALGPPERLSPQAVASSLATAPGGIGYVAVRGSLLRTRDRGRSWTPVE